MTSIWKDPKGRSYPRLSRSCSKDQEHEHSWSEHGGRIFANGCSQSIGSEEELRILRKAEAGNEIFLIPQGTSAIARLKRSKDQAPVNSYLLNEAWTVHGGDSFRGLFNFDVTSPTTSPPPVKRRGTSSEIKWKDLDIDSLLGLGEFADVYRAKLDGDIVAVKQERSTQLSNGAPSGQQSVSNFRLEIEILKTIKHPNIISLLGWGMTPSEVEGQPESEFAVLPFVSGGTMMMGLRKGALTLEAVVDCMSQLADAIAYLHSHKPAIIHRDVKLTNVMLRHTPDQGRKLLLIDFGLAVFVKKTDPNLPADRQTTTHQMDQRVGVPAYMAPEVFRCQPYSAMVDVYAFGCMLHRLLSAVLKNTTINNLRARLRTLPFMLSGQPWAFEARKPPVNSRWPKLLRELVVECLQINADNRPSFSQIQEKLKEAQKQLPQKQVPQKQVPQSSGAAAHMLPPQRML